MRNLNATDLLYIFIKDLMNGLKLQKMSKNWSLKENGSSYDQKCVFSNNSGQNIWNRLEKSSKIGQENKTLMSTFATKLIYFNP